MNKNTLYFRSMDILSISFLSLMIIAIIEAMLEGTTKPSQLITFLAFAMFGLLIISGLIFRKTKKDDFATLCSQKAYQFSGKFLLLWTPFFYMIAAFFHGVWDGMNNRRSPDFEIISNLNSENLLVIMWLIAMSAYLASFNWFRFKGIAS